MSRLEQICQYMQYMNENNRHMAYAVTIIRPNINIMISIIMIVIIIIIIIIIIILLLLLLLISSSSSSSSLLQFSPTYTLIIYNHHNQHRHHNYHLQYSINILFLTIITIIINFTIVTNVHTRSILLPCSLFINDDILPRMMLV